MDYFHGMIDKHIDLVCRRLLKGEDIPHIEKVFSVFESHTEWISKGKRNPSVELGHRVMITTDKNDLILDYKVMLREEDVEQPVELINRIMKNFENNVMPPFSWTGSISV